MRWTVPFLVLLLLLVPSGAADTPDNQSENASSQGAESSSQSNASGASSNSTQESEPSPEGDASGESDGGADVEGRCRPYEFTGGANDVRLSTDPVLGVIALTPEDCIDDYIRW